MVDFSVLSSRLGQQGHRKDIGEVEFAKGEFMGQVALVVETPLSLLEESAEELAYLVDATEEFELSEREEEDDALSAQHERMHLYKDLMQRAGKSKELAQLVDQLRGHKDKDDALRQVGERFPDPADAYAALDYVLEEAAQNGYSQEGVKALQEAQAQLMADQGYAIHSGIQAVIAAQSFAELDNGDNLRTLYRRTLFDFSSVNAMFTHILDTYGDGKFDQAITFLTRTLGADMNADVPSMGKPHLEHVVANLGLVRLLQSVHVQCVDMLNRWHTVHQVQDCPLDVQGLVGKILDLRAENFWGAVHFERILAEAKAPDIEREVLFLQDLMRIIRALPSQFFDTPAGHLKVISAVQEAVDNAIQREDAIYAAQQE